MKTIIKTNIKDNTNFEVKEKVSDIFDKLLSKGAFILLTRISHSRTESNLILAKSSIKFVKEQ